MNLVGGSYHAHLLMDIAFECLYKCDEGPVKEAALNSLKDLFRRIDVRHFEKLLIDFINRSKQTKHMKICSQNYSIIFCVFIIFEILLSFRKRSF